MVRPKGEAPPRESRVSFLVNEEEGRMLKELAEADSRSQSNWLRQIIRAQHGARFGAKKKGGAKTR